ncbi:MAG: hypothetical protein KAH21_06285 [Spirochaetaceae bacterium]|nr:hypothetical protein [Spirochaetaceae bacterium]
MFKIYESRNISSNADNIDIPNHTKAFLDPFTRTINEGNMTSQTSEEECSPPVLIISILVEINRMAMKIFANKTLLSIGFFLKKI